MSTPAEDFARRVWAEVTKTPHASVGELAARAGLVKSTVSRALCVLRDAGYIAIPARTLQARTVLVPFVLTKKAKH